ncbi:hypothetical protein BDR04DRAFT_1092869 [Suillus decipiens]|nr:hypothetical protein BDR04DRAFT_1092869 [Suillus decipiens]
MSVETLQFFYGDDRDSEDPADFLKSFNRAMRQQTATRQLTISQLDKEKLEAFGDYLGTSSEAEKWFKARPQEDKASWSAFTVAFGKRWPSIIAEKTKAEYEKELLDHKLSSEEVGKKMTLNNRECWTHVAWAAKILQLATNTGIAKGSSMIWLVRSKLPDVVKDLLKDQEYNSWKEFTKAVMELEGSRLIEKQEQHSEQSQELRALRADLARVQLRILQQDSEMALLQNQLNKMTISTSTPPAILSSNSTYARVPITANCQNSQSTYSRQPATPQQPMVVTDKLKTTVRQLILMMPHHPDDAIGHAAYAAQLTQWNTKWGESTRVTQETGYPLKPGTAAVASGECFACGTHGHDGQNCPLPLDHAERLTRKESAWREIVSEVLGVYNRATAAPILLVRMRRGNIRGQE